MIGRQLGWARSSSPGEIKYLLLHGLKQFCLGRKRGHRVDRTDARVGILLVRNDNRLRGGELGHSFIPCVNDLTASLG